MKNFLSVLIFCLILISSCSNEQDKGIIETYGHQSDGSKYAMVDGHRVHYRISGQGEEVVLLIHGIVDSLHTWDLLVPLLEDKYRVLRLDLPGFGLSEMISLDGDMVENTSRHMKMFLDEIKIKKVHLVGNSLGGLMSWNFSIRYSEYVNRVVLLSSGAFPQKFPWIFNISNPLINSIVRSYGKPILKNSIPIAGPFVPGLVGKTQHADFVEKQFLRIADLMTDERNFTNYVEILEHAYRYNFKDVNLLNKFKAPLLIIHGKKDLIIPSEGQVSNWRKVRPDAQVISTKDSAHMPQWENAQSLSKYIKQFLN